MTSNTTGPGQASDPPASQQRAIASLDVRGGIALSERTIQSVRLWAASGSRENPAELARMLLGFDAMFTALVLGETVYYFEMNPDPTRHEFADHGSPIWCLGFPDVVDPDPDIPVRDLADELLSDPSYVRIAYQAWREAVVTAESGERRSMTDADMRRVAFFEACESAHGMKLARALGLPFVANQLEAPICIYEELRREGVRRNATNAARSAMNMWKQVWRTGAMRGNILKETRFFTINMPFVLLAVLLECKRQDQLLDVGFELRESARKLRKWSALMDEETDLNQYVRAFEDLQHLAHSLLPLKDETDTRSRVQIGLSPSISIAGPSLRDVTSLGKRPHIKFLKRLYKASVKNARLETEVARVFEVKAEVAREAVALIDALPEY